MTNSCDNVCRSVALYYPYMRIQDINWLKSSLLYWDGIRRIAPDSFDTKDQDDVKKVVDEGLLTNTSPDIYKNDAARKFIEKATPILEEIPEAQTKMIQPSNTEEAPYQEITIRYNLLHNDKMPEDLKCFLRENKLLTDKDEGLSYVRSGVSDLYMACLASEMSANMNTPLLTDSAYQDKAGQYFSIASGQLPNKSDENKYSILRMLIDFPTSESLAGIDIDKIIEFNKKRIDERLRFRRAMKDFLETACNISDPHQLGDIISEKKKEIQRAKRDLRKSMKSIGIVSFGKGTGVCVSSPAAIIKLLSSFGSVDPKLIGLCAILGFSISFVAWYYSIDYTFSKFRKENDYFYLLSLDREILMGMDR